VRIVFDTNVLARAHPEARGPARRALLDAIAQGHVLVSSAYLLAELERILRYPRLMRSLGLTSEDVGSYVAHLAAISAVVVPSEIPKGLLRDQTDAPVVGTALAGRANVLCTRDADFYDERVAKFCNEKSIRVLSDLDLLRAADFYR
jgi:putative PIN family toxin of toxin-antitoxin system